MEYKNFDEYIEFFKKQPLKEKQDIIMEQLKMIASLANKMCNEINAKNEIIMNKELLDMKKDDYTEDDFAEAVIVLVNSIQNSLCDFDLKLTDIMEKQTINLD